MRVVKWERPEAVRRDGGCLETGERVESDRLEMSRFRELVLQNAVDVSCDPSSDFCKGAVWEGREW